MGFASADKDDPHRLRKTLIGAGTGAGLGALTGALAHGSKPTGMPFDEVKTILEEQAAQGAQNVRNATDQGFRLGFDEAFKAMKNQPEMLDDILKNMDPDKRKILLNKYDKSWLTRMFGG